MNRHCGGGMGDAEWERARLFPVSGIGGADEQERRAASALLAVIQSVREFGRTITAPMGAPAGRLSAFIEVPFTDGDKHLRPDGLLQVAFGRRTWTALVEVKTGRHDLVPGQIESYLDLVRKHKFDALLTISHQLAATPGVHPCLGKLPKSKLAATRLHHLSWSQIRTQALLQYGEKGISDPDQAWILAEFIRYLEHSRSGALDFDDMGQAWVHVRDHARTDTLHAQDKGAAEITERFGWLISYSAMHMSRELGTKVRPMVPPAQLRDPAKYFQEAVAELATSGRLSGSLRVPATVAPVTITADMRAGMIHCSVTVPAPREGRPTTRVNWLVRQLKSAPAHLCIEGTYAWHRGRGPARTLTEARNNPRTLLDDSGHELRAFTLTMSSSAGTARGLGHGSFINSVLAAVEKFYADVLQHLKPWTPVPPKVKDDDAAGGEHSDSAPEAGKISPAMEVTVDQYAASV
jgi:hypothetical protein